jgi:hypothetical protein
VSPFAFASEPPPSNRAANRAARSHRDSAAHCSRVGAVSVAPCRHRFASEPPPNNRSANREPWLSGSVRRLTNTSAKR